MDENLENNEVEINKEKTQENVKQKNKKFSIKKYLLTVLCSTIITVFIGFTILFINVIPNWFYGSVQMSIDADSTYMIDIGKNVENDISESYTEAKENYGEEYPFYGILLMKAANLFQSQNIVHTYLITLLSGLILGTITYIIFIQKARGKKLIIETFISIIIIGLIVLAIYYGYNYFFDICIERLNVK